ncbi:hypothetical protein DFQ26_009104, partial [Actinomortierella ambigua]
MVVTRSRSGTHPTPAPPATTPKQPTKRKSAPSSKPSKVAKTEGKPELAEAKAAAEAALAQNPETAGVDDETKNGTTEAAPVTAESSSSRAADSTTHAADIAALEAAVKEPAPETAPMPDVTTVLETTPQAVAQEASIDQPAVVVATAAPALSEPVAETAASPVVPPAPTAPSAATIPAPVTQEAPTTAQQAPVVASTEEPSAHTDATASSIKAYDVVVSDIEGTTTPITFVKNTLVSGTTAHTPGNTDINLGGGFMPSALDMPVPAPNVHSTAPFASYLHLASSQPGVGMAAPAATTATTATPLASGGGMGTSQLSKDDKAQLSEALSSTKDHTMPPHQLHSHRAATPYIGDGYMFPYVTDGLAPFLQKNWGVEELQNKVQGLRDQAAKDVADGVPNAVAISIESAD